ncbi:MAG: glycosyltransferase [Planctomycetaceae bacterium]|nr:glycosyltransferase [Planctomycetaceae bacterium]
MFSFIVPAHNEEALLRQTLQALRTAAESAGSVYELIVVDDASTDRTAEIAAAEGATVISVNLRKIAAVRNAGARSARGDKLIFVDADTVVPPEVLQATVRALTRGAIGGGARVKLDSAAPLWGRIVTGIIISIYFPLGFAPGCYLFARRAVFDEVGGFDEAYFVSEEVHLSRALRRRGRFVIIRDAVITSGRKFRVFTPWAFLKLLGHLLLRGPFRAVKQPQGLALWYDAPREKTPSASKAELHQESSL